MRTPRWIRRLAAGTALAVAAVAVVPFLLQAILVAPHAVFMNHRTRTGRVYLVNTGTEPEEVQIDLRYGYPDVDSTGRVFVRIIDTPAPGEPSAAEWIMAFPRRAVVRPGERQAIRLLAQPPESLADGEYWSRIIVTSREQPSVASADTAVRAAVRVELQTVISLNYRKGAVRTGIELDGFEASLERDSLVVWMGLHRQGNAAWLGTVDVSLRDGFGRTVDSWATPSALYVDSRRRMAFPIPTLAPGPYVVRLRLSTSRADLSSSDVLPAAPVQDSAVIQVQ